MKKDSSILRRIASYEKLAQESSTVPVPVTPTPEVSTDSLSYPVAKQTMESNRHMSGNFPSKYFSKITHDACIDVLTAIEGESRKIGDEESESNNNKRAMLQALRSKVNALLKNSNSGTCSSKSQADEKFNTIYSICNGILEAIGGSELASEIKNLKSQLSKDYQDIKSKFSSDSSYKSKIVRENPYDNKLINLPPFIHDRSPPFPQSKKSSRLAYGRSKFAQDSAFPSQPYIPKGTDVVADPEADTAGHPDKIWRGPKPATMPYGASQSDNGPMVQYIGEGRGELMDSSNPMFFDKMSMICRNAQRDVDNAKKLDAYLVENYQSDSVKEPLNMLKNDVKKIRTQVASLRRVSAQLKAVSPSSVASKTDSLITKFCNGADTALNQLSSLRTDTGKLSPLHPFTPNEKVMGYGKGHRPNQFNGRESFPGAPGADPSGKTREVTPIDGGRYDGTGSLTSKPEE
jgi:hypothetical protein